VPAAPHQPLEAELQPEKEEEEDETQLGDEAGHVGRLDEREGLRLVRAEEETREQVGRDRREAEATRDEPESAQDGDGDGELF
jgi:hypothetical protein